MKRGWFGPKGFGWGAAPASWQGWATTVVMVIAMVGAGMLISPSDSAAAWIARGVIAAAYLAVVVLTYSRDARNWL